MLNNRNKAVPFNKAIKMPKITIATATAINHRDQKLNLLMD